MSIVPKETIEVIGHSVGVTNLSPDVLPALAADVEYRLREIMQEAIKCMRHSRRTTLTTEDVDSALGLRNVEPIYGFASGDPTRFKRAAGHKDLFYIEERDVEFKEVIEAPLPKAPLDTAVVAHWLAIEGVQPAIPENPPPEALQMLSALPADYRKTAVKEDGVPVDMKLPIKHVLSRELQLYYEKITELTVSRSESPLFKEALVSLATDSGIHPLVPYFTFFVESEVKGEASRNMNKIPLLFALMRLVWSLLRNPHIHIEPYLHQLMPSVMTCLVSKRLGHKISDSHWDLRNFAASLVASICKRFGHVYHDLQSRVTSTLFQAFMDPSRSLPQHYGAIQGLAALGPNVVRSHVLPNLKSYLLLLEPEMQLEQQKNEMKRHEAWLVYGALMLADLLFKNRYIKFHILDVSSYLIDLHRASGLCIYDRLKMLPSLPSPPAHTFLKSNCKVLTTVVSNKRKARSMDNITTHQQPPLKKLVTGNSVGVGNSLQMDNMTVGADSGNLVQPSTMVNSNVGGGSSRRKEMKIGGRGLMKTLVDQAWKGDVNAGNFLRSSYEYFGESMFSFVPLPEINLFL